MGAPVMGAQETRYLKLAQVKLGHQDCRLFRNNVGVLLNKDGQRVRVGLCNGSSDLVGWRSHEVTQADVGRRLAVFVACEVKVPAGRLSDPQKRFLAAVRDAGGEALVVWGEDIQEYKL